MADQPDPSCAHCGALFEVSRWPAELKKDGHGFVAQCGRCRRSHGFFVSVIQDFDQEGNPVPSVMVDCVPVDAPGASDVGMGLEKDALGEKILAAALVPKRGSVSGDPDGEVGTSQQMHEDLISIFDPNPGVRKLEDGE